ncbi:MAG: hypothetical protein KC766_11405 [Myxococcales bacterium]|nr:hypothetical protein [Myxococcales bacterium]
MPRLTKQCFFACDRRLLAALSCLTALELQACGGSAPSPEPAESPGEQQLSSDGAPTAPASATAGQAAPEGAAPAPEVAKAPPKPSPLKPWAQFSADLKLFPLGTSNALLAGPPPEGGLSFNFMLLTRTGEISSPEGLNSQLPTWADLHTAAGEWPKSTFIGYVTGNGRVGWSQVSQATTKGWRSVDVNSPRWIDVGVQRWNKGRVLALAVDQFGFDNKAPTFRVVSGFPKRPVPKLAPSKLPKPKDGSPGCQSEIVPQGFAATELGHVFVVGPRCGAEDKPPIVEYFAPGSTKSKTLEVSGLVGGEGTTAVAKSDDDVYLSTGGQLLHFTGDGLQGVSEVPTALQVALSEQGTLWVAGADKLYRRVEGGEWETLPMPPGALASGLFAPDDEHVFVLAGKQLYALTEPSGGVKEYKAEFGPRPSESLSLPKAATADCKHLYALLYGFTKVTPDDYDFPLTRKAIKGQDWLENTRFVVTEDNGKKYFGAIPDDYEVGKRLVAHVTKKVKGSVPVLLCADPKVVRELPIDLATGEVKR